MSIKVSLNTERDSSADRSIDKLMKLLEGASLDARLSFVDDALASPEILTLLSSDKSPAVRLKVAKHKGAPSEGLERLSHDSSLLVRKAVALNLNTSPAVLGKLAGDEDEHVAFATIENVNTPSESLAYFAQLFVSQKEWELCYWLARNTGLSRETLNFLARTVKPNVRIAVALNSAIVSETLQELAEDELFKVRQAVANNSKTTGELLLKLALDCDEHVKDAALSNPSLYPYLRELAVKDGYCSSDYEIPDEWLESIYL